MSMDRYDTTGSQPTLITIGDIVVTPDEVITPQGRRPVGGVYWSMTDQSRTYQAIPGWAIAMAIIFAFFCLIGLLFLLAKEDRTEGWVQITVQGPSLYHAVQLPVSSPDDRARYQDMVNYARSVTASRQGW